MKFIFYKVLWYGWLLWIWKLRNIEKIANRSIHPKLEKIPEQ